MPEEKRKIWKKAKGHIREGVRLGSRLPESGSQLGFMRFSRSVLKWSTFTFDSRPMTTEASCRTLRPIGVPAHSLSWSFPHEHEESLYGRDVGELRSWESNLLDKSLASNIELLCKSKTRQG